MSPHGTTQPRVIVDGKFFRREENKFHLKGVTYGPFAPNDDREPFASREQTVRDVRQIRELGANLLRVYHVPPRWFLDLAAAQELQLLIDVPWPKHLCFLDSRSLQAEARSSVRDAVQACKDHPAVFAYSVVNEIPAEIVRWSGPDRVSRFIDELVAEARTIAPGALCTFTSYPPTEFLNPQSIDFVCFNIYLHQRVSFESYLAQLQILADSRPLVLGEFGMDSTREGEGHKCEFLEWQIESAFRAGVAGTVIFSFTDDWFRGGHQIEDWAFGLTTRNRQPKASYRTVQKQYRAAPYFLPPRYPKVSVVVASYNGARTLPACLDSLLGLNYPDYELILVDDGSTDATPQIAGRFPQVRYLRQANQGLSAARNAGIAAASGEIVAFTDSDCRADRDWLYYLVGDLSRGNFAGIGGHNFLPPDDSCVAAAVMVSPGGPAHVMLSDVEAEHIPGCNMVFYKWALQEIGGFDPVFRKAGDDVDVCWRLQDRGHKLGFSAAGFVWHYRRSTVGAYLKQQAGYGEAEALLARKHPENFNLLGGSTWRGRIYAAAHSGVITRRSVIYHGMFGSGFFQKLYAPQPALPLMLFTALSYHVFVTLPLFVLAVHGSSFFLPLALTSFLISMAVCVVASVQANLTRKQRRIWSRPLVALLFFLQPIVRDWARYKSAWGERSAPRYPSREAAPLSAGLESAEHAVYWSDGKLDRYSLLNAVFSRLGEGAWRTRLDTGYDDYDAEIMDGDWARVRLTTATEELEGGKKTFHFRLRPSWTMRGQIVFWSAVAGILLLIDLIVKAQPWIWLLPVALPILHLFLESEKRRVHRLISRTIAEVAGREKIMRLQPATCSTDATKPPAGTE